MKDEKPQGRHAIFDPKKTKGEDIVAFWKTQLRASIDAKKKNEAKEKVAGIEAALKQANIVDEIETKKATQKGQVVHGQNFSRSKKAR